MTQLEHTLKQRPPLYEVVMQDPASGTQAFLVVDTLQGGLAGGGIRMTPTVSLGEVRRLARAMTHKFSAIGVPMGGAKAGIVAAPGVPRGEALDAFARLVEPLLRAFYVAGEDMGTTAADVARIYRAAGCSWAEVVRRQTGVALPEAFDPTDFHGVNLEEQLTGFGVAEATEEACAVLGLDPKGARVAIQGFGTVGSVTAKNLSEKGFTIVAIADVEGAVHAPGGLPVEALLAAKDAYGTLDRARLDFPHQTLDRDAWLDVEAEVLIPAALADTVHRGNVGRVRARLVVEGANIPLTDEAEDVLFERGVAVVPDFIANAGAAGGFGLILTGQTEQAPEAVFAELGRRMRKVTRQVLARARRDGVSPRRAAVDLAEGRVAPEAG